MRGPLPAWFQLVLCAGLFGGLYAAWIEQSAVRSWLGLAVAAPEEGRREQRRGVPVIVTPVETGRDTLSIAAVGTGLAMRSVILRSEAAGKIVASELGAGLRFERGAAVLRLDDREQRIAVRLAQARLQEAERTLERRTRLQQSGAAATASYEEALTAVELARLELEQSRRALAQRIVRAPFVGVSGLPFIEPGDWVEAGADLASFDDRHILLVEFELPEKLLSRVTVGDSVEAETPAFAGRKFDGVVSQIDSRVDPGSRTARVRVGVRNEEDLLRPGASFTVRLELPGEPYPVVPELALQFSRGSLHVWRIRDGKAERIEVTLVRRRAGKVLVNGDLGEGDVVAVEGTQRLSPGKDVEILDGAMLNATEEARVFG